MSKSKRKRGRQFPRSKAPERSWLRERLDHVIGELFVQLFVAILVALVIGLLALQSEATRRQFKVGELVVTVGSDGRRAAELPNGSALP